MKCKQCRQEGSPINDLLVRLDSMDSLSVLSSCAGYHYENHHNIPEFPYILFSVKDIKTLEKVWKSVLSRLAVPTYLIYNGTSQFIFEIELPKEWPDRDNILVEVWTEIGNRLKEI